MKCSLRKCSLGKNCAWLIRGAQTETFSIMTGLARSRPQAARITIAFCFDRRGGFDGPRRRPIAVNLNH